MASIRETGEIIREVEEELYGPRRGRLRAAERDRRQRLDVLLSRAFSELLAGADAIAREREAGLRAVIEDREAKIDRLNLDLDSRLEEASRLSRLASLAGRAHRQTIEIFLEEADIPLELTSPSARRRQAEAWESRRIAAERSLEGENMAGPPGGRLPAFLRIGRQEEED